MATGGPSLVELRSIDYQTSRTVAVGAISKATLPALKIRNLERDAGVSHHTIEKILRGEPLRRKTLAKLAWILACSRSMFVRQHCSRIANLHLLQTPDQSRYDCVSIYGCYRPAVTPGQFPFIGCGLSHRSWGTQ